MPDIRHQSSCDAPLDVAFAYIDDHRNVAKWMFGVSRFTPQGDLEHGLGAVFDSVFAVKPVKLNSTVKITQWAQDELIVLDSIKGFKNTSTWRFSADGPERTTVRVVFNYQLPGGLAGKALGKALEPVAAITLRHSDEALRRQVEQHYALTRGN